MKVRLGFVSNSSSSSYLILIQEDRYQAFYDELTPEGQFIANKYGQPPVVLEGTTYSRLEWIDGERDYSWDEEEYEIDGILIHSDLLMDVRDDLLKEFQKLANKGQAFIHSEQS